MLQDAVLVLDLGFGSKPVTLVVAVLVASFEIKLIGAFLDFTGQITVIFQGDFLGAGLSRGLCLRRCLLGSLFSWHFISSSTNVLNYDHPIKEFPEICQPIL